MFQLLPLFESSPAVTRFALIGLALLVPAALILGLYRTETRLVRPGTARALLTLRLAVVTLIWLLTCFRPVVTRTTTEPIPGTLLVAVDRSDSMGITDPQRPPADKLRLALALNLATDLAPPEDLRRWLDEGERDSEDRLRRDAVAERIDAVTRVSIAEAVLSPDGAGLLDRVRERHAVEVIGFAGDAFDLPADAAGAVAQPVGGTGSTDLRAPLARANASGENLLGVVLLSDGRHNWGEPPVAVAEQLGGKGTGVPVFPVVLGPREPPADIALVSATAPPSVFQHAEATVEARVRVRNQPAGTVRVAVEGPGVEPMNETLEHDGSDQTYTVRFRVPMDEAGTSVLKLTAEPEDGTDMRDDHPENNVRSVSVNVAPERAKVLLIDGEARWEYHYLATALARDRTMELSPVVFGQPRIGAIPEDRLQELGYPARELPPGEDAFADYDCIILGDVPPSRLPPEELARLERAVADAGKTLVILAGDRSMPAGYLRDAEGPMSRLLPLESAREYASRNGFRVSLTDEGKRTAFVQLESQLVESLSRWESLPPHYSATVGRAKAGAEVLATVTPPADAATPGADWPRDNALIARQNYGFGRVLYVGLGSTWRWRFKTGDTYHHRFWGQVIRWAAERPLVAGTALVRFGTRSPVYDQSEPVDLIVRLGRELPEPKSGSLTGARVVRLGEGGGADEAVGLVPLEPVPDRPRELQGQTRGLPPGRYAIEPVLPDLDARVAALSAEGENPLQMRAEFRVLPPDNAEMAELAADWDLARELAVKSGGQVYAPHEVGDLIERLNATEATRQVTHVTKLWQSWWALAAFVLLLGVEWTARKWAGLP